MEELRNQPLAFSSQPSLISASSRLILHAKDGAVLNIEVFDFSQPTSQYSRTRTLLLFIPGICESAETKTMQNLVSEAKKRQIVVAVLELEGHGLSSGRRCVCPDFDKILTHVDEFVHYTTSYFHQSDNVPMSYFLAGVSLGGVLAIYAAEKLSKNTNDNIRFLGVAPISPAVGVDPQVIPPTFLVQCLKVLSFVAPAAKVPLTPLEDPTNYNCPEDTKRNFAGHWPLATSKMLLDVTSSRVKNDLDSGTLSLSDVESMLFIIGKDDHVIPFDIAQEVYHSLGTKTKEMLAVQKAGHDLLYEASSSLVCKALYDWMINCIHKL